MQTNLTNHKSCMDIPHTENKLKGTGEMAQWLRALPALPEDQGSIPSMQLQEMTTICDSSCTGYDALFWHFKALNACGAQTHSSKH